MPTPRIYIALLYLLAGTGPLAGLLAQTPEGEREKKKAEEVEIVERMTVVTRTDVSELLPPFAVTVIVREDRPDTEPGQSLGEALEPGTGLTVQDRVNPSLGDRISMRGIGTRAAFGVRGIRIIQDGIPLTMADGQTQLNNLELAAAERFELLKGPSSSLYGNASGGVILVETQGAPATGFSAEPELLAGAHGLWDARAGFRGPVGPGSVSLLFRETGLDGYRDHAIARYSRLNLVTRHRLSGNWHLRTVFNGFDAPYLLSPGSLSKEDAETAPASTRLALKQQASGKRVRQNQAGFAFSWSAGENASIETAVFGLTRSLFNPIPGRVVDVDREAAGFRAVFRRSLFSGGRGGRWLLGIDGEVQNDNRREWENLGLPEPLVESADHERRLDALRLGDFLIAQREKVRSTGYFGEMQVTLGGDWHLRGGLRYDRYRFTASDRLLGDGDDSGTRILERWSPMTGLTFLPRKGLKLYGHISTGFQTPTTAELGNRPDGTGGLNPELEPERLRNVELGAKIQPGRALALEVAVYHLTVSHMLVPFQTDSGEENFFRNAGRARNLGGEFALDWRPRTRLQTRIAYTHTDFEFRDYLLAVGDRTEQLKGREVPGVAPRRLFLSTRIDRDRFSIEVRARWVDAFFANDFNGPAEGEAAATSAFRNDAYATLDLRFGWRPKLGRWVFDLSAGVDNLFDERYSASVVPNAFGNRFFEPAPGRSAFIALKIPFARR